MTLKNKIRIQASLTQEEYDIFTQNREKAGIPKNSSYIIMRCCSTSDRMLSMKDIISANSSLESIREYCLTISDTYMPDYIQKDFNNIFSKINKEESE